MARLFGIGVILIGTVLGVAADANAAPPFVHYQPTLDITKDPGCGAKLRTPARRIAYNKMLAELYFLNFQNDRQNGRNFSWWTWNCIAPGSTVLLGAVGPLHDPSVKLTPVPGADPKELTGEQRGYFSTFSDWGTVPNTLVSVPFEGGAYFRMMYAGHDKEGKRYTIWETNMILVNDEGKITHFEMWNDTIGMDATTRKAFGRGIDELGLEGYDKATEAFPNK